MENIEENTLIVLEEVKYPVSTNEIREFVERWKEIPELDPMSENKEDFKLVKKAHLQAVSFRTSIEKTRKKLKAPALAYGKNVDAIAKEFQELINPKELELFAERNKVEQYEKDQELKRIEAERERVENIANAIASLKMIPLDHMGESSEVLTDIYDAIGMPSEEIFGERLDEAILTYKETLNKLETAIEQTKLAENAQALQDEAETKRKKEDSEREKVRKEEREAFEKERSDFEEKKKQQEREIQEQQEDINKQKAEVEAEELAKLQEEETTKKRSKDLAQYKINFQQTYDDMNLAAVGIEPEFVFAEIIQWVKNGKIRHIKWEG